jgi:hypothetical protein
MADTHDTAFGPDTTTRTQRNGATVSMTMTGSLTTEAIVDSAIAAAFHANATGTIRTAATSRQLERSAHRHLDALTLTAGDLAKAGTLLDELADAVSHIVGHRVTDALADLREVLQAAKEEAQIPGAA